MSPYQHGFMKRRSTMTNLLEFSSKVLNGFASYEQTDVIYTDFSKAFDTVNHNLLLLKLEKMGFSLPLLAWIKSYLLFRVQFVQFNDILSSNVINVTSGVPQGSHLGPLLFTLFINDLPSIIANSNILMYADDVKLFLPINQLTSSYLNCLLEWCNCNRLFLNCSKCKVMSFSRRYLLFTSYTFGNSNLERVYFSRSRNNDGS